MLIVIALIRELIIYRFQGNFPRSNRSIRNSYTILLWQGSNDAYRHGFVTHSNYTNGHEVLYGSGRPYLFLRNGAPSAHPTKLSFLCGLCAFAGDIPIPLDAATPSSAICG